MSHPGPDAALVQAMVANALAEDVGSGDVTAGILGAAARTEAHILTREPGVLCGQRWAEQAFRSLDPEVEVDWLHADGDRIAAGAHLCRLAGRARGLLTAERVALNFLQTLSGTATRTAHYVQAVSHTRTRILDTRKTLPGWRVAQKYAVRQGGGVNHRLGLFDAFLIKENHIAAAGSISRAARQARILDPGLMLEIEIEHLGQLEEALAAKADRILLDNFTLGDIRQAVATVDHRCPLEASGGITLENIGSFAETGVDFISVGDLTKNVRALDLSLRLSGR